MDFNQSIEYCRERNRLRSLGLDPRLAKRPRNKSILAHIVIKDKINNKVIKESLIFKCSYCNHKLTKDMTKLKNGELFHVTCPICDNVTCKSKEERY